MKKFGTVVAIGMRDKEPKNADLVLSPVSTDSEWSSLSPFFLGPCRTPDGTLFANMENLWQFSKVYDQHLDMAGDLYHGEINADWWAWHMHGARQQKARRYPMGKGAVPLFSKWGSLRLSYVNARKVIYIPQYARLVEQQKLYRKLVRAYARGANIVLRDFDAYDIFSAYEDKHWVNAIQNKDRKFGHGFVIALCIKFHQTPLWYDNWVLG